MRKNKHAVALTDDQRMALEQRFAGPLTLRQRNRVQVLLRSDAGDPDADIAGELGISVGTVANVRKRFAAEGLEAALTEKPRKGGPAVLDGKGEAVVIALACSPAPEGWVVWTAGMLANRLVELKVVESVSEDTILRVLKKATSSRGRRRAGASRRG
jgi:transposase